MNVFELFSGIGGMHFAFKESGMDVSIAAALDINTTANHVYTYNFPETKLMENNIQCLSENLFNDNNIEVISMSPPCQPFTRVGLKKGSEDNRCDALHHVLEIIPKLTTVKYILMENVVGFDTSSTRDHVLDVLKSANFRYQEFILSPTQLYIPNSRRRYYLLAKKNNLKFCFEERDSIHNELPIVSDETTLQKVNRFKKENGKCFPVEDIIDQNADGLLSDKILHRFSDILDIVTKDDRNTCCFTKAYSHYIEGTGSVFCPLLKKDIDIIYRNIKQFEKGDEKYVELLRTLKMRFFTPLEVSRLMCFPNSFGFPSDLSNKQRYRLLGNSINVHVVAVLIRLLLC